LGHLDAGDPDIRTKSGDTPRSVGIQHHAGSRHRHRHHISNAPQKASKDITSEFGKLATYDDIAAEYGDHSIGVSSVASDVVATKLESESEIAEKAPPKLASSISRLQMAQFIVNQEARRDAHGRLKVYHLPKSDGGGRFEVAGINERYDTRKCLQLVAMVKAGQYAAAEREAVLYIAGKTDEAAKWTRVPAVELFLRDTIFNRGLGGAMRILRMALGVVVHSQVTTAVLQAEQNPRHFIERLRAAREEYEWKVVGRRANMVAGLINRWNHVRDEALRRITS
jgi:hypothetical protein